MSLRRVASVMRLHGLDVGRRRLVVAMLAVFPILLYAATERDNFAVVLVGTLMSFSVAGPRIFVALTGRAIDARLILAGYRRTELATGRLLLLACAGLAVATVFAGLVIAVSDPAEVGYLLVGLAAVVLITVPLGLALGSALPGDLEALMVLMTLIGMQLVAPQRSTIHRVLPMHGSSQLLRRSNNPQVSLAWPITSLVIWVLILTAVTFAAAPRSHAG